MRGSSLYIRISDVRQILTYKDGPRAQRVNNWTIMMAILTTRCRDWQVKTGSVHFVTTTEIITMDTVTTNNVYIQCTRCYCHDTGNTIKKWYFFWGCIFRSFEDGIANAISSFKWRKMFLFKKNIHLPNWIILSNEYLSQNILSILVTFYLALQLPVMIVFYQFLLAH